MSNTHAEAPPSPVAAFSDTGDTPSGGNEEIAQRVRERQRAIRAEADAKDAALAGDVVADVLALAHKRTSLTLSLEEMRAMAKLLEDPPRSKVSRETVKARGVPEEHLAHVYDREPVDCAALNAVREFIDDRDRRILVLSGGLGTMKSGSACWALTQRQGYAMRWSAYVRLCLGQGGNDGPELFRRILSDRLGVFVLQEFGIYDGKSDWTRDQFDELVDTRYEHRVKTIVTTNLDKPRFVSIVGERVIDRMRQVGTFVTVGGESVRSVKR